jgi:hypothetical protein
VVRAEPVSVLTEQGKVRFAGRFPQLEEELCAFTTTGYTGSGSPNRADAMIWAISELFPGIVKKQDARRIEERPSAAKHSPTGGAQDGWREDAWRGWLSRRTSSSSGRWSRW